MTEMKRRLDETGCPATCDFVGRLVFLYPSGHTVCQMLRMGILFLKILVIGQAVRRIKRITGYIDAQLTKRLLIVSGKHNC